MAERIVIIGAGIIGLGIGWQMAKSGRDVLVLEARKPGRGAAWAAAGILSARLQAGDPLQPLTRFQRHSQDLWPDFAAELESASGLDVGLRREGAIVLALADEEAATLHGMLHRPFAGEHGFRWLDAAALHEAEPQLAKDARGGLLSRFDHQVDNRAVVKALRLAFDRAGGELRMGDPVRRIEVEGSAVRGVETDAGFEPCRTVVLAAGAWSARVAGLPAAAVPPVQPVAGQMLALAGDPEEPLLHHVVMTAGGYLVPRTDGRLLVGATSEDRGFDGRNTPTGLMTLIGILEGALPEALELPIAESWVGFRPGSPDHAPILGGGPVEGLVYATGHSHNGILMTPATIEAVCIHLLTGERDPALEAFSIGRFAEG